MIRIFLVKEFSITKYLKGYNLAGFDRSTEYTGPQREKNFLWIGLIFLNFQSIKQKEAFNVNCGYASNVLVDSGGYTNYYLHYAQPQVRYFRKNLHTRLYLQQL